MLTPEQIRAHKFRSAGKGLYRSDDVDAFFKDAVKAFEKTQESAAETQKTNDELYQRVEALANALNQMRAERDLIQKTMITAQKAADELTEKAKAESSHSLQSAKSDAEKLRTEARREAEALQTNARREAEKLLLETQAQAENLQAKARARAEKLFEEARSTAQDELVRISAQTQHEQQELMRLRRDTARLRNTLLDSLAQQMALIEQIPAVEEAEWEEIVPEQEPLPQPEPEPEPEPEIEPEPAFEAEPLPEEAFAEVFEENAAPADPFAELAALEEEANAEDEDDETHFDEEEY